MVGGNGSKVGMLGHRTEEEPSEEKGSRGEKPRDAGRISEQHQGAPCERSPGAARAPQAPRSWALGAGGSSGRRAPTPSPRTARRLRCCRGGSPRPAGRARAARGRRQRRGEEMCLEECCAAGLGELRSWWDIRAIAHFCLLFPTAFRLPDFEIAEDVSAGASAAILDHEMRKLRCKVPRKAIVVPGQHLLPIPAQCSWHAAGCDLDFLEAVCTHRGKLLTFSGPQFPHL
ncbi:uncharacterized protein LOC144578728 [Callithrix jacchus]